MATIPFQGTPTVPESTQGARQTIQATPEDFGAGIGKGLGEIGQEQTATGQMLAQHAIAFQNQNNEIAVDDKYTKLLSGSNDISLKFKSLQGQDAIDGYQAAHDALFKMRDDLSAGLGNKAQQIIFDNDSRRFVSYQADALAEHAATQRQMLIKQQKTAIVELATQTAIINYKNPTLVAKSTADALFAWDQANPGASDEERTFGHLQRLSEINSGIISRISSDGDDFAAQRYFNAHIGQLTPDKITAFDNYFKKNLAPQEAQNGALSIMQGYGGEIPTSDKFVHSIEVDGEKTPDGRKSSSGAVGVMQVLPSTGMEIARKNGIAWDADAFANGVKKPDGTIDWSYNRKIGGLYANQMMREFHSVPLAAFAYESGDGNVKDAIQRFGDPRLGQISMEDFLNKAATLGGPKGTGLPVGAAYARRVSAGLNIGPGTVATSGNPNDHRDAWLGQARNFGTYAEPDNPTLGKMTEAVVDSEIGRHQKAVNDVRQNANQSLANLLYGGPDGQARRPTSVDELYQMDPQSKVWVAALKPTERAHILKTLSDNAIGKNIPATPTSNAEVNRLLGESVHNPNTFAQENINEYGDLPYKDRQMLIAKQRQLITKPQPNEDINHALSIARKFGVDDVIGGDITSEKGQQFTGALMQNIQRFEQVHARKPNDSDIVNMTRGLLLEDSAASGFFSTAHAFESAYASRIGVIPPEDQAKIVANYTKHFGKAPTPGQIVYWYDRVHPNG